MKSITATLVERWGRRLMATMALVCVVGVSAWAEKNVIAEKSKSADRNVERSDKVEIASTRSRYVGEKVLEKQSQNEEKAYLCNYADEPIKIDGVLDEPAWKNAEVLHFKIPRSLKEPVSKTEAKILWDDKYLYVSFKAYDKDVWSYKKERDSSTCDDDVLEVFVKPRPDKDPYYNFEINALTTVFDAYNVKRWAGGGRHHRWSRWNCSGLKLAVHVEGTLNNWKDQDKYWRMEVAIPFAELQSIDGKTPAAGDIWLFLLGRYDFSIYLPNGRELSTSADLTQRNFAHYEDWSRLKFVKKK